MCYSHGPFSLKYLEFTFILIINLSFIKNAVFSLNNTAPVQMPSRLLPQFDTYQSFTVAMLP